ncbi:MAG: hypothetical protein HY910_15545 [Desulfarculus sp.]|nr:hypothetical protein [Desulfarculus sp.]
MDMRVSQATAVIVQRVPAAEVGWFMDWQRGITSAAEGFSGYRVTDVYPPAGGQEGDWVVAVSFDDKESLRGWLDSPVREQWVEKLQARVGNFTLKVIPGGFGSWFAGCVQSPDGASPPSWKMALVVLLGLYPTVMLLTLFPGPYTQPLGLALAMLIGNALSVAILQWAVMPVLNNLSANWLGANAANQRALSIGGLLVILVLLAGMAYLFRLVTG